MRYIISGKNIDVTEGLKETIYDKIGKLEKYFSEDTEVTVTLSVEKSRHSSPSPLDNGGKRATIILALS